MHHFFLFVPGSWDLHRNFFAVFFTQDAGCTETEGHARLLQGRESWFVFATSWQVWSSLNIAQICALKPHDFHLHWKLVLCLFEKWVALNHPKSIGQSSFPCIENAIWGVYHGYIMVYGTIPNLTQPIPPWISFATRGLSAVYTKLGWCEEAMAKMMEAHETFQVGDSHGDGGWLRNPAPPKGWLKQVETL